jgi:hypothetical protein
MQLSSEIVNACTKTIMNCRQCIAAISRKEPLNKGYLRSYKQCEDVCRAYLQAASVDSPYLAKLAILCIGLCEECIEIGEDMQEPVFKNTAAICALFSNLLSDFLSAQQKTAMHA